MICPYCGQEIEDGAAQCPVCCAVFTQQELENAGEEPFVTEDLKNNNWGVPMTTMFLNLKEPVHLFKTTAEQAAMEQKLAPKVPAPAKKQSVLGIVSFCMSLTLVMTPISLITSIIDVIIMFITAGKPVAKKHGMGVTAFIISLFFVAIFMEWI